MGQACNDCAIGHCQVAAGGQGDSASASDCHLPRSQPVDLNGGMHKLFVN